MNLQVGAETVDISLFWEYPREAKFNVYRKFENSNWEKIATVDKKRFVIKGSEVVEQIFKVSAVTGEGESPTTSTIYLISKKINAPSWKKVLTGVDNKIIVESPTKLQLFGTVQP